MITYMIQWCRLDGSIAYVVYKNDEDGMKQEIVDGLNDGYIMQVGKIVKEMSTD